MSVADGANYAPKSQPNRVVEDGEFIIAAAHLDHGHIYGQVQGLLDAGATLKWVYEPDSSKRDAFCQQHPGVQVADSLDEILSDNSIQLVASAAVPSERAGLGSQVLKSGKDYFTDKSPFTSLGQLADIRETVSETGGRYFVYYAERVHNEAAWYAGELIKEGAIGRVLHVLSIAPHRLSASTRPDWFFQKSKYGGIITDIGSHQVEQFLTYTGSEAAEVSMARVANLENASFPGLEDFGEFSLVSDNQASFYSRVDWFTPTGSEVWGDGRTFITGSEGTMELRKYIDLNRETPSAKIFLTDGDGLTEIDCQGKVGFPFFGQLILDSLHRTEEAMTQEHIFLAAELSMRAQAVAEGII